MTLVQPDSLLFGTGIVWRSSDRRWNLLGAEVGDDRGGGGVGCIDLGDALYLDEAAGHPVPAAHGGEHAMSGVVLILCDYVTGERLDDSSVGEAANHSICLHRPGDREFCLKRDGMRLDEPPQATWARAL